MTATTPNDDRSTEPQGKGRATPTRAEREAARRRPLVANTKEARAQQRAELAVQRERARAGMAAGDDRYLPERDRGPQRRYLRDWVDARWTIAEWIMPAMILVLLASLIQIPAVQVYSFVVLWGFILLVVVEMIVNGQLAKRAVKRKFGETRVQRGTAWYAAMRTMQMRVLRMPKPQVKRGAKLA